MKKRIVDLDTLIRTEEIPKGVKLKKVAAITYKGVTALIPYESIYDGTYRLEYLKRTGIPLPQQDIPNKPKEYFCPTLRDVVEIDL